MRQKRLLQGKTAISQILEKTDKVIKGRPTRAFLFRIYYHLIMR